MSGLKRRNVNNDALESINSIKKTTTTNNLDSNTLRSSINSDENISTEVIDRLYHKSHPTEFEPPKYWKRKRIIFTIGIILGILLGSSYYSSQDPLANLNLDLDRFSSLDYTSLLADLPTMPGLSLNISELLAPGRDWLRSKQNNFEIGRDASRRGDKKQHAVVIIPGIISSGLESWSTTPAASSFFRERIWAGTSMFRAIVTRKEQWIAAMMLDPETGLDPPGYKVRAAEGLDGASSFMPGFWLWSKVIENLSVLGYDQSDMKLASYDWRVAWINLEIRDQYFSRLKAGIEFSLAIQGKKTVIISHSMGSQVALYFLKWVEAEGHGNGGKDWVEIHIESFVSVAGTFLGVPKAMSALLSGEMRDTVEINTAGAKILERFFSRNERATLFRSWAGAASMMLKGGNDMWGDNESAPDDKENATLSGGNIYYFRSEEGVASDKITRDTTSNLTLQDAHNYILEHVDVNYQKMLSSNYSFNFERNQDQIALNDNDPRKWTNPLEIRLPNAPSLKIYCIYGVGKETERSYWYQNGGYSREGVISTENSKCEDCSDSTPRVPLDLPLSRKSWIDSTVNLDSENPKVRSGVIFGEGDGTVSLLSLGAMSVEGWKRDTYNPARIPVTTYEILHDPVVLDLRGGPRTADHVDILGSTEMQAALLDVVTGNGGRVKDRFYSDIRKYASRIKWDG